MSECLIDDHKFAEIAQLIQNTTSCGGLTSNILTKRICLILGIKECNGHQIAMYEWEKPYVAEIEQLRQEIAILKNDLGWWRDGVKKVDP